MKKQMKIGPAVTGIFLTALIIFSSLLPVPVFAGGNVPAKIDIEVTYKVDGNAGTAGGDRFTLTADDPSAPMPEGTVSGRKTITVSDEGSYSFGDIRFGRPDVFWYTVTRDVSDKKGVVKDDSVYRAKVAALNDGHGYVLVYKDGSDEKQELVYTDRVTDRGTPATGDNNPVKIYSGVAAAAALALVLFAAAGKKNKRKEVRHETEKNLY